jgi:tetratricopeptide (TPR) repeat protein
VDLLRGDRLLRRQLLVDLGYAQIDGGELDSARAAFDEALETAAAAGDDASAARARVGRLVYESMRPSSEEDMLEQIRREIVVLEAAGDDSGLAEAWEFAGALEAYLGRTRVAGELWEQASARARASGHHRLQQRVEGTRLLQEAWGHLPADQGLNNCERLLDEAEGTALEPFVLGARALYRSWQGNFAGAREDVRRGQALLRELGNKLRADSATMIEAQIELTANDPAAAEAAARQGYEALGRVGEQGFRSTVGCLLAEALCLQGHDREAERIAIEAAAMTSVDDFVTHARSIATRATVLARRGGAEPAVRLANEAVTITAETDSFAEHAHALVALADVLQLTDPQSDVAAILTKAAAAYDRKGATAGADAVRRRLAAEQI